MVPLGTEGHREVDHNRTSRVLEQIADALGVGTSAFREQQSCGQSGQFHLLYQEAEMLRLFAAITDPARRVNCLDYIRTLAQA